MQFEDILIGAGEDEFGNMCGFAPFPYFQRNIEVTCEDGVTPEYAAKSLQWLAQVDEALIREICQYACYYLQDTLERTSVGELLDEEIQHIQDPMEILRYMDLGMLHISEPLDPGIPVLNLSGGCDWREDEGLQCLIREGRTVYLGSWSDLDIWRSPCLGEENYLFNYIYYPRRDELRARAAERLAEHPVKVIPHLEIPMSSPLRHFIEGPFARLEGCSEEEAWARIENTLLFEFLQEYPRLMEESDLFRHRCFCMERDQGPGEMAQYLAEHCDIF
jgi:hypothetical protein